MFEQILCGGADKIPAFLRIYISMSIWFYILICFSMFVSLHSCHSFHLICLYKFIHLTLFILFISTYLFNSFLLFLLTCQPVWLSYTFESIYSQLLQPLIRKNSVKFATSCDVSKLQLAVSFRELHRLDNEITWFISHLLDLIKFTENLIC